jgi:hypothetical protein
MSNVEINTEDGRSNIECRMSNVEVKSEGRSLKAVDE